MLELFRPGDSLAWDYAWQSSAFLILGGAASLLWARRPARAHRVLLLAMIAGLLAPPLSQGVRRLDWGLLANPPVAIAPARVADLSARPDLATPRADTGMLIGLREPVPAPAPAVAREPQGPTQPRRVASPSRTASMHWKDIVTAAWAVLGGLVAARLLLSLAQGLGLVARAHPLEDAAIRAAAEAARGRLGLSTAPEVFVSNRVRCPVIWCWGRRPVMVVPESARQGAGIDWMAVLCHELAHWKRRDHLSGLVGELLACVLPWHPLAWWAKARLGQLSELACDDWVLAVGQPASDYAESLLGLVPQRRPTMALAAVSSRSGLVARIRHILDERRSSPVVGTRWAGIAVVATLLATAGFALAQPRRSAADDTAGNRKEARKDEQTPKVKGGQVQHREVKGTVLGPDGKARTGQTVLWIGRMKPRLSPVALPMDQLAGSKNNSTTLARAKTDADGRFAFAADIDPAEYFGAQIIVAARGAGLLAHQLIDQETDLSLTLPPEVSIRGRLLTPAGAPAAGVKVSLAGIMDADSKNGMHMPEARHGGELPSFWPQPQTTDASGRFVLHGVPKDVFATLNFTHENFAVEEVVVTTGPESSLGLKAFEIVPVKPDFVHTMEPARPVQGVVTAKDTGKPMANVLVQMTAMRSHGGQPRYTRTDAEGRYRIAGEQADIYITVVYPPSESGYISVQGWHQGWPAGAKALEKDFALPRGRFLRGTVIDADTKAPIAGASIVYQPKTGNPHAKNEYELRNPVLTDQKGQFVITGLPGEGYLIAEAPTPDYRRVTLSRGPRNQTWFPHGFTELDVPADGESPLAEVSLHKGVTVEARAVGPNGEKLPFVSAFCKELGARQVGRWDQGVRFEGGLFRMTDGEPGRIYRVFFVQPDLHLGAVAELKYDPDASEPTEVRLQETASVRGTLTDKGAMPAPGTQVYPLVLLTDESREFKRDELYSNDVATFYSNLMGQEHLLVYSSRLKPDSQGLFLIDTLIPGVRYYIMAGTGKREARRAVPPLKPGEVKEIGTLALEDRE